MVIDQLKGLGGVARVKLTWTDTSIPLEVAKRGLRPFFKGGSLEVTPPRYDSLVENKTVSLVSDLKTSTGRTVGKLEVVLGFDYLIDTILAAGWWQSDQAYLVDDSGRILSSARPAGRLRLGDHNDPLELKTLNAMQKKPYGTVIGTDGIWETDNAAGSKFGKERLRQIIRRNSQGTSEKILQAITAALAGFRGTAPQEDDVTLVVVKKQAIEPDVP